MKFTSTALYLLALAMIYYLARLPDPEIAAAQGACKNNLYVGCDVVLGRIATQ
jgi:hypothetical protein